MPRPAVVLVHGLWVTSASWDRFRRPFEAAGYAVHVPTWPLLGGRDAAALRTAPPPGLGRLSIREIVDHFAATIRALPEPPLLVGHSFGGLFVQLLLDRGCGAAGVALNPAPFPGLWPDLVAIGGAAPAVARLAGWRRPYSLGLDRFRRRYANTAPAEQQAAAYAQYVIPTSGRVLHEAALGLGPRLDPRRRRQPLLITGASDDRLISPALSRAAFDRQRRSPATTDYHEFTGRSHLLCDEPGWEAVARTVLAWASRCEAGVGPATGPSALRL